VTVSTNSSSLLSLSQVVPAFPAFEKLTGNGSPTGFQQEREK